jgi:hypothetical protein
MNAALPGSSPFQCVRREEFRWKNIGSESIRHTEIVIISCHAIRDSPFLRPDGEKVYHNLMILE